jgi:hypothetical protein
MLRRITVLGITSVSQNRYSTALDPFLEFAVHLGVYGKVSWSSFLEYLIGRFVLSRTGTTES